MPKPPRYQFPPAPQPLPANIVDNHTHLESISPYVERAGGEPISIGALIQQAADAGVDRIVQCGCELPSARWTDRILRYGFADGDTEPQSADDSRWDEMQGGVVGRVRRYASAATTPQVAHLVGAIAIHPNEAVHHAGVREIAADGLPPQPREHHQVPLADAIAEIAQLAANNPRIRAIGETGMDLFRAGPLGAEAQKESFRAHIALAKELNLALQIHDRDAHQQVIDILLKDGAPERTVFHCFSGDVEMAQLCASNGWYLSIAGPVTYRANEVLRDVVRRVPLELLLVETDAPYLTPHPYRGQPNAPFVVAYTAQFIAETRLMTLLDLCRAISQNSETVYGSWAMDG